MIRARADLSAPCRYDGTHFFVTPILHHNQRPLLLTDNLSSLRHLHRVLSDSVIWNDLCGVQGSTKELRRRR